MNHIIETTSLTKHFGNVTAVDAVSLALERVRSTGFSASAVAEKRPPGDPRTQHIAERDLPQAGIIRYGILCVTCIAGFVDPTAWWRFADQTQSPLRCPVRSRPQSIFTGNIGIGIFFNKNADENIRQ